MNIEKEFVPYQESLELKELGFDEPCLCFYNYNSQLLRYMNPDKDWNSLQSQTLKNSKITLPDTYSAPTFSQCFKWFREKYGLPSHIATYWQHDWNNYSYQYYFVQDKVEWNGIEHYKTYEEAELACLRKLIEIVKNK
jgi:hypothetical protein